MTEVEFSHLLADLSRTAEALNRESASVNTLISSLEETLRTLNLGLEVWITSKSLASEAWTEEEGGVHGTTETQLGFAKHGQRWALVTREATYQTLNERRALLSTETTHLLAAEARHLRFAALELFPDLVRALKDAAEEALEAIEVAKKLVN